MHPTQRAANLTAVPLLPENNLKNKAAFKYIAALLLFGTNGIVAGQIALSSYEIVFTRTLIGAIFLVGLFVLSKQTRRFGKNKRQTLYLLISGAAMGASWVFLFEAYKLTGVSTATLAYYCGPVIVLILSPLLFKEKLTAVKVTGFLAVMLGMFGVNAQALLQGQVSWGLVFGILSAGMYAVMVIFNKQATSITGLENPMWQLMASFITVAVFLGFKQGFAITLPPDSVIPILVLGIINTGAGCYLYFSSIGDLPAQTVAMLGYLEPLSALFFSAAILQESLGFWQLAGAALILGGAAFGELYHQRRALNLPDKSLAG